MTIEQKAQPKALLTATGLFKQYGGVRAVNGVDFHISENEVVGIIGPNGSGKTTLFNLLTGFARVSSGSVIWKGKDITSLNDHARPRLGLVRTFQEAMVFPGLTVRENIRLAVHAARRFGKHNKSEDELLEYVQVSHVQDSLATDLSWGQTRLLGIALALAVDPSLLLLDEPFAGLSPVAAEQISAIVTRMKADGYTLCVIDHEMTYLLPICDRLVVLVNGEKLADGVPNEVIEMQSVREAYLGL